jgi:hypothetical protein
MTTPVLTRADDRLQSFSRCHGTRALPAMGLNRIRQRLDKLHPDPEEHPSETAAVNSPASESATERITAASDAIPAAIEAAAWETVLEQCGAFGTMETPLSSNRRVDALNRISEDLSFDTGWLFQLTPDGKAFTVSTTVGDHARGGQGTPACIRPGERTVFGVCLQRREVVVLHNTSDRTITRYLPEWWIDVIAAPKAVALIPIQRAGKVTAVLLAGWRNPRRVTLTESQVAQAHDQCLRAISNSAD